MLHKYIVVANRPNRISTLHLSSCRDLGNEPLRQTASSTRAVFSDGISALAFAHYAEPENFGLCGHCLSTQQGLLRAARKS